MTIFVDKLLKVFRTMGNQASASNHAPLERGVGKFGDFNTRRSLRSPRKMDRLRKSFRDSFRRRKDRVPDSLKPHQWQADESAVRAGTCTFSVKYLGCVEVFDSRGMQVCEEALKVLRGSRRRPTRAVLHVAGDGLRVVEEDTKGLIVDQTIEKISFCAPDRNHERGFSYICRDGTTRRWMCHGFLAARESGERLSHAVGCAFSVCLEMKQKRDRECGVTMSFDMKNNTFTRQGSFRQTTMTERAIDVVPNAPSKPPPVNPFAIERPHATPNLLQRQGSCRTFSTLGQSSPFKRQMSLRVNELPSTTARLTQYNSTKSPTSPISNGKLPELRELQKPAVSPVVENSADSVTALCQQLSQGLNQLTHSTSDDFNFNNPSSLNQNTVNLNLTTINNTFTQPQVPVAPSGSKSSVLNSTIQSLNSTSNSTFNQPINSTFNHAITATPTATGTTTITPVTLSFSPNGKAPPVTLTISPIRNATPVTIGSRSTSVTTSSVNTSGISVGSSNMSSTSALPKPEQWLGQIVKSTSPVPGRMDGSSPRRNPALVSSRAMSLDTGSESFRSKQPDPFDAEWAENAARQNTANTNPFLTSSNTPTAFQLQL